MKKPVIGITCPWSVETWGSTMEDGGYYYVGRPYVEAISRFGGIPVLISPECEHTERTMNIQGYLSILDGVLFTGGGDVKRPLGAKLENLRNQQPVRYDYEKELLEAFVDAKKPVLGICRGFQMIIETFGGSLAEELVDGHKQKLPAWEPWHDVIINSQSKLYDLLKTERTGVNSFHVQQAEDLPKNFIVSAKTEDGVIEAIEFTGGQFIMGFQFHPEELVRQNGEFGKVFEMFIAEATNVNPK